MNSSPQLCLWLKYIILVSSSLSCLSSASSSIPLRPHNSVLLSSFLPKPQACTRAADKDTNTTSGSSPHDRDSLSGWRQEFKKTDKYSFIATYLKQLITYGRWCGIFSVGCLWTNSVVLCKLPIWPSLCISLTLVALHWHVLRAEDILRRRDKERPV